MEHIHNYSNRLYRIWKYMRDRCYCKTDTAYELYGGRGISICKEWSNFDSFADWALANGYSDNLTIERDNVDGNYEPSNCRWITIDEQQRNKRTSVKITIDGITKNLCTWADEAGISHHTIRNRMVNGIVGKALLEPTRESEHDMKYLTYDEKRNKWIVQIREKNIFVYKKGFSSLEEATEARDLFLTSRVS